MAQQGSQETAAVPSSRGAFSFGALRQGYLEKKGGGEGGRRSWKKRWFVLTDTKLFYFKTEQETALLAPKPQGVIELEDFVKWSAAAEEKKGGGFVFSIETHHRAWSFKTETKEEQAQWSSSVGAIGELLKAAKQAKSVHSSNDYETKLIKATHAMLIFSSKLVVTSFHMIQKTRSDEFRDELSRFVLQIGANTVALVKASLSGSKSPFDKTITSKVIDVSNNIKNLLGVMVKVSISHNKGKGGENSEFKEAFIFSIKGLTDGLAEVLQLSTPDAAAEIANAAQFLRRSAKELTEVKQKENEAAVIKKVKDDMRLLFGLINVSAPAASSPALQSEIKQTALKLHYSVKQLITSVTETIESSGPHAEVEAGIEAVIALTEKVFPDGNKKPAVFQTEVNKTAEHTQSIASLQAQIDRMTKLKDEASQKQDYDAAYYYKTQMEKLCEILQVKTGGVPQEVAPAPIVESETLKEGEQQAKGEVPVVVADAVEEAPTSSAEPQGGDIIAQEEPSTAQSKQSSHDQEGGKEEEEKNVEVASTSATAQPSPPDQQTKTVQPPQATGGWKRIQLTDYQKDQLK